jgi:phosphoribosylanthranilate isomerase
MIWIKICGITRIEDARSAIKAGADAIGFVFAESPRKVTIKQAKTIITHLPKKVTKVGVFVNEDPQVVRKIADECALDMVQFHGEETPEYCMQFRGPKLKIIKAFRISKKIPCIHRYKVDFYLLDTFVKNIQGGTGKTFNWDLAILAKKQGVPIILSGGLNENNIKDAIRKVKPFGVDVSSGVESLPGKKVASKIQKFIELARSELCDI